MSEKAISEFVLRKKVWRSEQARLSMANKAQIVEELRERHLSFRAIRALRRKKDHSSKIKG